MTYDWIALHSTAADHFSSLVDAVRDWDQETPDSEWNVAELVSHVISTESGIPAALAGHRKSEQLRRRPQTGTDTAQLRGSELSAHWRQTLERSRQAINTTSATALVDTGRGRVSAGEFLSNDVVELTIHGWDLARAIGANDTINGSLVDAVWSRIEPLGDTLAATGFYADAVRLAPGASAQERLLAATGRDPRPAA